MNSDHIRAFLSEHRLRGEVVVLPEHTPTVEAAARAVGASVERIAKSILFIADGAPVLVIANGLSRVDYRRVADYLGLTRKKLKLADSDTVLNITGFRVGTVPPFGHKTRLRTLMDVNVLVQPEVFAGGGAIDALLRITPAEIVRATNAEKVDVVMLTEG